ncbi:MAG: phosphotransferase [Anaerolineaceae bacterium]|nr:phosphotransferase [Anaerolineaceae bacterium]
MNKTEFYAQKLLKNQPETTLCHGDIHGWNLLIPNESSLFIVDWDTLVFAPKERDLMFIGCGLGGRSLSPIQEEVFFYEGYGQAFINPVAMAYYRYERVIEDFAVCCEHIFSTENDNEDRQLSMRIIKSYFLPNSPLDYAHQYVTKFLK